MKRISNAKLSSGAGLDLTTAKKRGSSSSSTHKTNSESSASDADVRVKKKARRKVRCTQDFNQIDRRSVFPPSESVKKVTTKKKKNLDFLPKVCFGIDSPAEKENFSPKIETGDSGDGARAKKIRKRKSSLKILLPSVDLAKSTKKNRASIGSLPKNTESTPEEKRDSEIVFKKRKKKSKKPKDITTGSAPDDVEDRTELKSEESVSTKLQRSSSLTKKSNSVKTSKTETQPELLDTQQELLETQQELLEPIPVDCGVHSISSGDIYIEQTNETFGTDQNSSNTSMKMNPDLERKSVRFRSTFEVQDITTNISGLKSITIEDSYRDEGSLKQYRKSPHVSKLSHKLSNICKAARQLSSAKVYKNRGNIAIVSPSLRESASRPIDSKALFSKTSQNRQSTFEMPSPILGPEKAVKSSLGQSHSRHKSVNKDVSVINLLTPTPKKGESSVFGEATPSKLLRESTFTMDERVANQTSESVQPLDVSKSNGRRRWNKSLGVSFFDSSGNLHNISPPWSEEPIDLSMSKDTPKDNKKMLLKESVSSRKVQKTTPTTASTNVLVNKKHSLRSELLKDNCKDVKMNESKNGTMKRPKMPNFALIHQRAFDKLENLKEMSERKAVRAKLLLSGLKPVAEAPAKAKSPAKSKKMLLYSPKPSLPVTKTVRSPIRTRFIAPSVSNPKVVPKLLEKKPVVSQIPKLAKNKNLPERQKFTKLGFKVGADAAKKTTKEEQVKAVVTKSKVQTNTVDTRRNVIQNVRSNRRFELLMKMRNK